MNPLDWIVDLAKNIKASEINGWDLDIVLKEMYSENFKLINFQDRNRPMALIAFSNTEEYGEGNRIYERIFQFRTYEIGKHFGCSLDEFLNYPRDRVEYILTLMRGEHAKLEQIRRKAEQDAARQQQQAPVKGDAQVHMPAFVPPPRT